MKPISTTLTNGVDVKDIPTWKLTNSLEYIKNEIKNKRVVVLYLPNTNWYEIPSEAYYQDDIKIIEAELESRKGN